MLVENDYVEPIAAVKAHALVGDWQRSLALELEPTFGQLGTHTGLVGRLHQTWTKIPMDLDERTDHIICPIPQKSSVLPLFLCHPLSSGHARNSCWLLRRK